MISTPEVVAAQEIGHEGSCRGQVVAQSNDVIDCKGYQYFPQSTVRMDWLQKTAKTADDLKCPMACSSTTSSSMATATPAPRGLTRHRGRR